LLTPSKPHSLLHCTTGCHSSHSSPLNFPPAALDFPAKPNHHLTLKTFRLPNTQYAPQLTRPRATA
ncbi:hypothetical protein FCV25MIE_16777, partial [Fagus crenata]